MRHDASNATSAQRRDDGARGGVEWGRQSDALTLIASVANVWVPAVIASTSLSSFPKRLALSASVIMPAVAFPIPVLKSCSSILSNLACSAGSSVDRATKPAAMPLLMLLAPVTVSAAFVKPVSAAASVDEVFLICSAKPVARGKAWFVRSTTISTAFAFEESVAEGVEGGGER